MVWMVFCSLYISLEWLVEEVGSLVTMNSRKLKKKTGTRCPFSFYVKYNTKSSVLYFDRLYNFVFNMFFYKFEMVYGT